MEFESPVDLTQLLTSNFRQPIVGSWIVGGWKLRKKWLGSEKIFIRYLSNVKFTALVFCRKTCGPWMKFFLRSFFYKKELMREK